MSILSGVLSGGDRRPVFTGVARAKYIGEYPVAFSLRHVRTRAGENAWEVVMEDTKQVGGTLWWDSPDRYSTLATVTSLAAGFAEYFTGLGANVLLDKPSQERLREWMQQELATGRAP